ncbi:MAG: esterase/lipase family protein [Candidatus Binataceae bacterium]
MIQRFSFDALSILNELRSFGELAKFYRDSARIPLPAHRRERSVLLIPGFLAGDASLYPLADWMRARGHHVFFSGIFTNADCPRRVLQRLGAIVADMSAQHREHLTVIGHSLGGIYARELARRYPGQIEQVILLGAPIHDPLHSSNPSVRAVALFCACLQEALRGCSGGFATVCGVNRSEPPPVPETIIYSKRDGVVDWHSCLEYGPEVETIEVDSTHCAMPYCLEVLRIIAARLEGDALAAPGEAKRSRVDQWSETKQAGESASNV